MQILLVSDLHYTLKQLDWVMSVADNYELVVVAGDHLDIASGVEPEAQIAVVLEYFSRIAARTTVVACSGNHDLNARNEFEERAAVWLEEARRSGVVVDGMRLVTDEMVLTVCPWWDGPRTCDVVDRQLVADAVLVGARQWFWVYHAPPDDSPTSWTGRRHYGDEELRAWIERFRPDVVVCGHVHESPFATEGSWIDCIGSTLVLNSGREIGAVPPHIEIDTDTGTVRWSSSAAVEERTLAGA